MNKSRQWVEPPALLAHEIAAQVQRGEYSAVVYVEQLIARIEKFNSDLNAMVIDCFEQARLDAKRLDALQAAGKTAGPLHGVPISIKECFFVAGTDCTIGLDLFVGKPSTEDGPLVRRLREAGAIVMCKTNIPQTMLWHESVNPVYGRTNNPWDMTRTPGGSSGGEAAMLAAGGSVLGLGNDLGGSLRVPAHFCGIFSLKPTNGLLPRNSSRGNMRGMEAMLAQPGPMGHCVDDLVRMFDVLIGDVRDVKDLGQLPVGRRDVPSDLGCAAAKIKIGIIQDDGFFTASPAIRRSVQEAGAAMEKLGVEVVPFEVPDVELMVKLYLGAMTADGGFQIRRGLKGGRVHKPFGRLVKATGIPRILRPSIAAVLRMFGEHYQARLVSSTGGLSAKWYWLLIDAMNRYRRQFTRAMQKQSIDVLLSPSFALPAMLHGDGVDLIPAASYSFLHNLVGGPAGMVPWSTVAEGEESDRERVRDSVVRKAIATETGSVGLPVGVQVAALPWQEHLVLAVMRKLEEAIPRSQTAGRSEQ
jgi:fatty acid amide hydrolase